MRILQLTILFFALVYAQGAGEGYWDSTGYHGELDVDVIQVIKGCTMSSTGHDGTDNTAKDAADLVLKRTIAGISGLSLSAIQNTVNDPWGVAAGTGSNTDGIVLTYKLKATDITDYKSVSDRFAQGTSTGTFTNLLHLFQASTASSPICLATASVGTYSMISSVNTFSPTYAPTIAPTPFTAEHFGFLLNKYVVASAIIGSIFGLMILYYGYWGCNYLVIRFDERQQRLENELHAEVNKANQRLHDKFKVDVDKSPHTSKMRENFKKQFGALPTGIESDRYRGNESQLGDVPLTNLSAGASSAPRGAQMARTLATKLPGGGSSRATSSRSYDEESGEVLLSNASSSPKTPSNLPLSSAYDDDANDKSNRFAKGNGRKAFGFTPESPIGRR